MIPLREYIDMRFAEQEKNVQSAMAASDRAISKAEMASERRFESVNEFRATLADSARLLMPRAEVEQIVKGLESKIGGLQRLVWVGTGIVLAFQFFLGLAMILWKGK